MTFYLSKELVIIAGGNDKWIHNYDKEELMITLKIMKINLECKLTQNTSIEFH